MGLGVLAGVILLASKKTVGTAGGEEKSVGFIGKRILV